MEGYINEKRWVDLSGLPRWNTRGSLVGRINWSQTVGYNIPFRYNYVTGNIHILKYDKRDVPGNKGQAFLTIVIDKYVPIPIEVRYNMITECKLHNLVDNRIINKAPELVRYLYDPNDAYLFTYQSNKKVRTRCSVCGHMGENYVTVMYKNGFFCPMCSDTATIPNKVMFNVLKQLNIPFMREVNHTHFPWMQRFFYDFYINIDGENILIEMDGGYHKFDYNKITDAKKTQLAIDNNFKLIRIDCNYKTKDDPCLYIKNNILKSELSLFVDINKVDWDKCKQYTITNVMKMECEMWENGSSVMEIASHFQVNINTITAHLKRGKELGFCPSYNHEESVRRSIIAKRKPVAFIYDNQISMVFRSTWDVEEQSMDVFGMHLLHQGIANVCLGIKKTYFGKIFKYITKEEYEQYKMIENKNITSSYKEELI